MSSNAVQLKIPAFWRKDPELWFVQLEKQLVLHDIQPDHTRFSYVVSVIDTDVLSHVRRIVLSPPESGKYKAIKDGIIAAFRESDQSRLTQLLSGMELGNRKPSQLLDHMVQLAAGVLEDQSVIRKLWMQKLHPSARAILAAFPRTHSLLALAQTADNIVESMQTASVNAIDTPTEKPDAVTELSQRFEALATEIRQMKTRPDNRRRSPVRRNSNLCWFHEKFGSQARRCRAPCSFKTKNLVSCRPRWGAADFSSRIPPQPTFSVSTLDPM